MKDVRTYLNSVSKDPIGEQEGVEKVYMEKNKSKPVLKFNKE